MPTETQYVVAAYSLSPAVTTVAGLSREWTGLPPVLAVKSAAEALDYVPKVSDLGQKLLRRFWPGPVTLEFAAPHVGADPLAARGDRGGGEFREWAVDSMSGP